MAPSGYLSAFQIIGPIMVQPGTGWCAMTGELAKDEHDAPNALLLDRSPDLDAGVHWRTDALATVNLEGKAFTQAGGYWECKAKMPTGLVSRPSFFLTSMNAFDPNRTDLACEINVFESYGGAIQKCREHIYTWDASNVTVSNLSHERVMWLAATYTYQTFSVLIEPNYCTFAIAGNLEWRVPTPAGAMQPMMATVELALGTGWDANNMVAPSALIIEALNVYRKPISGH